MTAVVVVTAFFLGTTTAPSRPGAPPGQPVPRPPRLVRALLLIGFAGLALWFLGQRLSPADVPLPLVAVLEVLAGDVLGMTASWLVPRRAPLSTVRARVGTAVPAVAPGGALGPAAYTCSSLL